MGCFKRPYVRLSLLRELSAKLTEGENHSLAYRHSL